MNEALFSEFSSLIRQSSGIFLTDRKKSLFKGRIQYRLRTLEMDEVSYLDLVKDDQEERRQLLEAISTNVTSFFREAEQFSILAKMLKESYGSQSLRIWCCASSSGEEPYTIAITCLEALGPHPNVKILATDINTKVLTVAKKGIYHRDRMDGLSHERLRRFFDRGEGRAKGYYRAKASLRELVRFAPLNLVEQPYPIRKGVDIVFCRNVLYYFEPAMREKVVSGLHDVMRPGGVLFTAMSESQQPFRNLFQSLGPSVGERR